MFVGSHPKGTFWKIRDRRAFSIENYDTLLTCLKFVSSWQGYLKYM